MIISVTPMRVSFCGGGSDLFQWYSKEIGKVCSTTIDKYIYVIVNKRYDDKIYITYSKKEIVDSVEEIQHELVRECLKRVGVLRGIEIMMLSDIPSEGSGLGSSSSLVVGLLNALYHYINEPQTKEILAIQANEIEIIDCGKPIGLQDGFAASFGGLKTYTFGIKPDKWKAGISYTYDHEMHFSTKVDKVNIDEYSLHKFKQNLMMFWTGGTRPSSSILVEQKKRTEEGDNDEYFREMVSMVNKFVGYLVSNEYDKCGFLLNEAWEFKKKISSGISNPKLDSIYNKVISLGAFGGKVLGAGGQGFWLFYVPLEAQDKVRNYMSTKGLREMPFDFDLHGSRILLNNPTKSW